MIRSFLKTVLRGTGWLALAVVWNAVLIGVRDLVQMLAGSSDASLLAAAAVQIGLSVGLYVIAKSRVSVPHGLWILALTFVGIGIQMAVIEEGITYAIRALPPYVVDGLYGDEWFSSTGIDLGGFLEDEIPWLIIGTLAFGLRRPGRIIPSMKAGISLAVVLAILAGIGPVVSWDLLRTTYTLVDAFGWSQDFKGEQTFELYDGVGEVDVPYRQLATLEANIIEPPGWLCVPESPERFTQTVTIEPMKNETRPISVFLWVHETRTMWEEWRAEAEAEEAYVPIEVPLATSPGHPVDAYVGTKPSWRDDVEMQAFLHVYVDDAKTPVSMIAMVYHAEDEAPSQSDLLELLKPFRLWPPTDSPAQ